MAGNALIQTRIDPKIRDKATEVLAKSGLTARALHRLFLQHTRCFRIGHHVSTAQAPPRPPLWPLVSGL